MSSLSQSRYLTAIFIVISAYLLLLNDVIMYFAAAGASKPPKLPLAQGRPRHPPNTPFIGPTPFTTPKRQLDHFTLSHSNATNSLLITIVRPTHPWTHPTHYPKQNPDPVNCLSIAHQKDRHTDKVQKTTCTNRPLMLRSATA